MPIPNDTTHADESLAEIEADHLFAEKQVPSMAEMKAEISRIEARETHYDPGYMQGLASFAIWLDDWKRTGHHLGDSDMPIPDSTPLAKGPSPAWFATLAAAGEHLAIIRATLELLPDDEPKKLALESLVGVVSDAFNAGLQTALDALDETEQPSASGAEIVAEDLEFAARQ